MQISEQCTWLFILLEREMARNTIIYWFMGCVLMIMDLEETWLKKLGQGYLGKRHMDKPLCMGEKTWRCLWLMWMLIKGWPQQRMMLIYKWLGWPVLWRPINLFFYLLLPSPNRLINKVPWYYGWRLWWTQTYGFPLTNTDLATTAADAQSASKKDNIEIPLQQHP